MAMIANPNSESLYRMTWVIPPSLGTLWIRQAGNETTLHQNITVNNNYVPECPKSLRTAVNDIDYAESSCLSTEVINAHLGKCTYCYIIARR